MRWVVKLLDIQGVILELYDCSFIIVSVAVIRCGENRYDLWKTFTLPIEHLKSFDLNLVSSYKRKQLIFSQKSGKGLCPIDITTSPLIVINESILQKSILLVHWIAPKYIAKNSWFWWLLKSVHFINIFKRFQLRRNPSMKSDEFLVNNCRQG